MVRKFKTLALLCVFTSFAGVMYELIDEDHLDFSSVMFGFPLGLDLMSMVVGKRDLWMSERSIMPRSCHELK
jgi:hypothetical protein